MRGKIFDTNKLIKQWWNARKRPFAEHTRSDAEAWAGELIGIYQTNLILTPVYIEFIGGLTNRHEMELGKVYLDAFLILDDGDIRPDDWIKARQLAERIPSDARRRGAIDCLIKAMTIRLRCDLLTDDVGMPRH